MPDGRPEPKWFLLTRILVAIGGLGSLILAEVASELFFIAASGLFVISVALPMAFEALSRRPGSGHHQ